MRPPKGVVIPRTPLFATVGEIVVLDPHKIEFRLTEPRPQAFMLGAFASGWNIIVRKKTLDDNQGNLRQVMNYPGTGPFRHVSRQDKEVWIQEQNPNYWNKGLPYVDRLEIYNLPPFSPELGVVVPRPARSTTRGSWIRSRGARPRRCRASPRPRSTSRSSRRSG